MNRTYKALAAGCTLFSIIAVSPVRADSAIDFGPGVSGLRDKRYCEVIYGNRDVFALNVKVYNTLGLNDCPAALWNQISVASVEKAYDASFVKLNGPRYWVLDGIRAAGQSVSNDKASFGGIEMTLRATVSLGLIDQLRGGSAYTSTTINRTTIFVYAAGSEIYELTSPSGQSYVMQSYSQIVNPKLSMRDLPELAKQLKLPDGWTYQTRRLNEDLMLVAKGEARVLQDDLQNTYQRR